MKDHITKEIADLLFIDLNQVQEVTTEQKNRLRARFTNNLKIHGVCYDDVERQIIFTNEESYKNWLYYAGLEYVDKDTFEYVKAAGRFICVGAADYDDNGRLDEIMDILSDK